MLDASNSTTPRLPARVGVGYKAQHYADIIADAGPVRLAGDPCGELHGRRRRADCPDQGAGSERFPILSSWGWPEYRRRRRRWIKDHLARLKTLLSDGWSLPHFPSTSPGRPTTRAF